jgi:hypothetical protein
MRPILRVAATALALGFVSIPLAQARDIPSDGVTLEDVKAWLQEQGNEATITNDGAGHTIVSSKLGETKFGVYMFDCNNAKRCGSIQFAAGWPTNGKIPVTKVNEWNRTKRWGRAYLDDSGGMWLESDVDLTPGGTYELLNDMFATWKKSVEGFRSFFSLN